MENIGCTRIVLSSQAHLAIVAETYERVGTETGGILLGKIVDSVWYVVEVIDPGPNSIFRPSYFEYDTPYVNHLSNKVARFYREPIGLLGLWHRHPGSFDSFSSTDDGTNTRYATQNSNGAISAIVNLDPQFRITAYHVSLPLRYTRVPMVFGDHLIPPHLLSLKELHDFIPSQQQVRSTRQVHTSQPRPTDHQQPKAVENFFHSVANLVSSVIATPQQTAEQPEQMEGSSNGNTQATQTQEAVLEMLDEEMNYLESQPDYEYAISMRGDEVGITMTYVQAMPYYPLNLNCILSISENGSRYVAINGLRMPYKPGIIRLYVNNAVVEAAGRDGGRRY